MKTLDRALSAAALGFALLSPIRPLRAADAGLLIAPGQGLQIRGNLVINGGIVIFGDGNSSTEESKPDAAGPHVIRFANGDCLHGTLEALDVAGGRCIWRRPDASPSLDLPLDQVFGISFGNETVADETPTATIKFTGGDWLTGTVTALEGDKLLLRLKDGTRVTTSRARVEWIYFSKSGPAECYDGPTSASGWNSGGMWTYREGALWATRPSSIQREFQILPDQVEYRLRVDQGKSQRAFTIMLHQATGRQRVNRRMIQIAVQAPTLNVWASFEGGFKSQQVTFDALEGGQSLQAKGPTHLRIFEDFTGGRLLVWMNGRKIGEWKIDKGDAGKNGGGLRVQPTIWSGEEEQSISRIQVLPWDGREPVEEEADAGDRVSLSGGESKTGRLLAIDERTLRLESERRTVSLPRDEVALLRFRRPGHPPEEEAPMARLQLATGGEFDVLKLGWRDGEILAQTNFGGEVALLPAAVAELEFLRPGKAAEEAVNTLVFQNGDRLRGALQLASGTGKLRWKTGESAAPVEFMTGQIAGLQWPPQAAQPPGNVTLRFRNGDWLTGKFITLDATEVVFETKQLGQRAVSRAAVQALYFNSDEGAMVSDATSDHALWERGLDLNAGSVQHKTSGNAPNSWNYFAGRYSFNRETLLENMGSSGRLQLGRLFEALPERAEVRFTVSSQRSSIYFGAQVFTDLSNPGYVMHFNTNGVAIYDMNPRHRARGGAQQQFSFGKEIQQGARERHIRLLADRGPGRLVVIVDGVVVARLYPKTSNPPRNLGRGLMLMPQPSLPCTFSNFWVGPWNGQLPGKIDAPVAGREIIVLANGDETRGTINLATPTSVKLTSEVGPLELPVDRLTMIDFGGEPRERPAGIRLHFAGQGALTMRDWRIEGGAIFGTSEIFNEISVPLRYLQEAVFSDLLPHPPPTALP